VITEQRVQNKGVQSKETRTWERRTPKKETAAETEVTFVCDLDPGAKEVFVAGDFNEWSLAPMARRDEKFTAKMRLRPGEYQYKYKVDGKWHTDPAAPQMPNTFGTMNSVLRV